jgi:hypothetical protein
MERKQMELQEVLTMAIATLLVVVLSHFAVYWTVKTLYPPPPKIIQVPVPMPVAPPPPVEQAYIPPAVTEQHVELPTYATPVSVEAPREERKGPPPPEDTSSRRKPGMDGANA